MKTCFVTGAAGFIGSNFVRQVLDEDLDVRGIAVQAEDDTATVDVVLSTNRARVYPPGFYDDAADIALKVAAEPALRERFPSLAVQGAELLQLTGPPDAVDFWRAHSVLWSTVLGQTGAGGPTTDFAEGRGIFLGVADDGPRLTPWSTASPGLGPKREKDNYAALWVMGGLVLAWLVVRTF